MSAEEALRAGKLDEALDKLQDQVREDPSNAKLRTFLFQLLSIRGEYKRAQKQLAVAGDLDNSALAMVQTYRELLASEAVRSEIFRGQLSPILFGEPAEWLAYLVRSVQLSGQEKYEEAGADRAKAFDMAPTTSGTIDGEAFEWIADADTRLGPVLEVVMNGRLQWIPFVNLTQIELEAPEDLRDLVWAPAYLTFVTGGQQVAFVPARYPGSEASDDHAIRMSRKTEWVEKPGDTFLGLGQRMLATSLGEHPLLQVRKIELNNEPKEAKAEG